MWLHTLTLNTKPLSPYVVSGNNEYSLFDLLYERNEKFHTGERVEHASTHTPQLFKTSEQQLETTVSI